MLVCDGISWIMEYQLADKPVIFYERPDHVPFNMLGEIVRLGTNVVHNKDELLQTLTAFAEGAEDPKQTGRAQVRELLNVNAPATQNIIAAIKEKLRDEGWRGSNS